MNRKIINTSIILILLLVWALLIISQQKKNTLEITYTNPMRVHSYFIKIPLQEAIIVTPHGNMTVTLHTKEMPKTTSLFSELVRSGFYNEIQVTRKIDNFMTQIAMNYSQPLDYWSSIDPEISEIEADYGSLVFIRAEDKQGASRQFVIVTDDTYITDENIIGKITLGAELISKLEVNDTMQVIAP